MRRPTVAMAALAAVALGPSEALAMLDCQKIKADGYMFNLGELKGPHSVVTSWYDSGSDTYHNTTYTVDICNPLKKSDKGKECPKGTRVCGIRRLITADQDIVSEVIAISGELKDHGGGDLDHTPTRLKTSDSTSDREKEGLRLVLQGGKHPLDGTVKDRKLQKTVIEFLCDKDKTGTEGEWEAEDKYSTRADDGDKEREDQDHSAKEHQLKKDGAALLWKSYEEEKDTGVLRLEWHTKFACEEKRDDDDKNKDGDKDKDDKNKDGDKEKPGDDAPQTENWGFFTWLIIIVFMSVAAYLIFGSWLNYNRYGARGWDLLPHGDAIRDVPYLMKDWLRRVLNSVQGAGSRGGYSAV